MEQVAGIVLAGGRSSRMGQPKASLPWHGQTLLGRVAGILGRCGLEPIVVVRAPGQALPALAPRVEIVSDAHEGRGPLEGLDAGLRTIEGRALSAFVCSTDVPFLLPAFVHAVLSGLDRAAEIAVPQVDDRLHPLTAAYRVSVRRRVEVLLAEDERRLVDLLAQTATRCLPEAVLRRVDPQLGSLRNLNRLDAYEAALAEPLPLIRVERAGAHGGESTIVRATTLGAAVALARLTLGGHARIELNGEQVPCDPGLPLVDGDLLILEA